MTKKLFTVTILFCLIIGMFLVPSFASSNFVDVPYSSDVTYNGVISNGYYIGKDSGYDVYAVKTKEEYQLYPFYVAGTSSGLYFASEVRSGSGFYGYITFGRNNVTPAQFTTYNSGLYLYYGFGLSNVLTDLNIPSFSTVSDGLDALRDYIDNPPSQYTKNPNVDEFIANTLISMGVRYSQYSDALSIASEAWDYIIDENNWYIGSGDRNDKDIVWNIDNAVSYVNAQSNNYLDWYNGYKVNKDLTVALTKFISDNYTASSLGQGTLVGYNVSYDSNYSYSAGGYGFGGSPSAYSFYPASTITYFNGAYLHENDVIDQDEFVYTPADVRKFLGYSSSAGIIDPPTSSNGTGVITDGNGDTVYNIDLDWPSFDWLAEAIQAVLDFLDRLITTIADFLTQILDAILSLFSDAFESLTEFGEGIIEWLYDIIAGFSTIGSNYIPASLWAVILPFILINIGVGLIMFVMRSH